MSKRVLENAPEEEDDLSELQSEINEMATKILEFRSTLPELLNSQFASLLEAYRPLIKLPACVSDPVVSKDGAVNNLEVESDNETAGKLQLLKQNLSGNASAIPILLKRMNDCISKKDKLDTCNFTVNSVFKRKRIE